MAKFLPATQLFVSLLVCLSPVLTPVRAGENSSFSNLDLDANEAKIALEMALEENAALQEKLAVSEATAAKLTQSIAIANSEAEVFRRQSGELKLRLEALGLEAAGGNQGKLEQRLLKAVSDLRIAEEARKRASDALLGLSEAVIRFLSVAETKDSEARLALEAQMRQATAAITGASTAGDNAPSGANLAEASVISIKEELNLIVINVGSRQGVKVGMPFQVSRGNQVIGTVRVVDVRDRISGALVQNLVAEKEKIHGGDRLKVEAQP
ncbi:hypothetical protein ACXR0O_02095 [Verrucomicrobiota bacterium sgz303538]